MIGISRIRPDVRFGSFSDIEREYEGGLLNSRRLFR